MILTLTGLSLSTIAITTALHKQHSAGSIAYPTRCFLTYIAMLGAGLALLGGALS